MNLKILRIILNVVGEFICEKKEKRRRFKKGGIKDLR